jgi:hypothetical protein
MFYIPLVSTHKDPAPAAYGTHSVRYAIHTLRGTLHLSTGYASRLPMGRERIPKFGMWAGELSPHPKFRGFSRSGEETPP